MKGMEISLARLGLFRKKLFKITFMDYDEKEEASKKAAFYIFAKEDMMMIVRNRHEQKEPREDFAK